MTLLLRNPLSLIRWLLVGLCCLPAALMAATAEVRISELDSDTAGEDKAEFIELQGPAGQSLKGYSLVLYNGSNGKAYQQWDLGNERLDNHGFWLLCGSSAEVRGCQLKVKDGFLQNGPDAVALYQQPLAALDLSKGVVTRDLVDALVYGTGKADALLPLLAGDKSFASEQAGNAKDRDSLQRCQSGLRSGVAFRAAQPTPGAANRCDGSAMDAAASAPTTSGAKNKTDADLCQLQDGLQPIYRIQGRIDNLQHDDSPLTGQTLVTEGVVTLALQSGKLANGEDSQRYRGFWMQTPGGDGDSRSSDGIFVYHDRDAVQAGDRVRVRGQVAEYYGSTQITKVSALAVCGRGQALPAPVPLSLPVADLLQLEALEGMRVTLSRPLLVSDFYGAGNSFANQGQLVVSSDLHFQPGALMHPGSSQARQLLQDYLRDRLLLDDGVAASYPEFIPFPDARGFAADRPVRIGDTLESATGVLLANKDWYVLVPEQYQLRNTHPRTAAPLVAASANLRIASMNVLNYFNGDGKGGGFPTGRGATSAEAFAMQSAKIVAALRAMDADIVALMELENDGDAAGSAMARLLSELNQGLAAAKRYEAVPIASANKRSAIRSALIYRPARVQLAGAGVSLDSTSSPRDAQGPLFDSGRHRPSLVQTFRAGSQEFTLATAHFKSKGSACKEPNEGADGQGNCNRARLRAARGLLQFLQQRPTGSRSDAVLILGDLNAYAKEDPVRAIVDAGYVDLKHSAAATEARPWTYSYGGMLGSLDHVLATPGFSKLVVSAGAWHINAAESDLLGYQTDQNGDEYPSRDHYANPDQWRSSDHDPVIVGMRIPGI